MAQIEKRFEEASKLLENPEFIEKLNTVETDKECQKLFADYGVQLSEEDIASMVKESAAVSKNGELDASDLDNVSGGILITASCLACFAIGSAAIGFFAGYGARALKRR